MKLDVRQRVTSRDSWSCFNIGFPKSYSPYKAVRQPDPYLRVYQQIL